MTILDPRGKAPNYVLLDGRMIHQPSGLSVEVRPGGGFEALREAQETLDALIAEAK